MVCDERNEEAAKKKKKKGTEICNGRWFLRVSSCVFGHDSVLLLKGRGRVRKQEIHSEIKRVKQREREGNRKK